MTADPEGADRVKEVLIDAAEKTADNFVAECFDIVNELDGLGHRTKSAMMEMRRRIHASCEVSVG